MPSASTRAAAVSTESAGPARSILAGLLWLVVIGLSPPDLQAETPRIAIVIDDMGYQSGNDRAILALDRRVAVAVIPEAPGASTISAEATAQGREVLIHLPLEGLGHDNCQPALTCIGRDWSVDRIQRHLNEALDRVSGAVGLNNHQGSRFTRDAEAVARLVDGIERVGRSRGQPLFVLDSRTVVDTLFEASALDAGLRATRRQVFLDHRHDPVTIRMAWEDVLDLARYHGSALVIGHPRDHTIRFLEEILPTLAAENIELVPPSVLTRVRPTAAGRTHGRTKAAP